MRQRGESAAERQLCIGFRYSSVSAVGFIDGFLRVRKQDNKLQLCYKNRMRVMLYSIRVMTMANILVADDEPAIREMLKTHLRLAGHTCLPAADAEEARRMLAEQSADIALVDIIMPGEDGFSLAGDLINRGIPVLFLTAKTAVADRVRGLRMGAEDYILKPFEPEELLARIDVILRRTRPKIFSENGITVDFDARAVTADGEDVSLTGLEFDLLALLTSNAGAALSRDKILAAVWGWEFAGETRTVDVHVQRLRAKLGAETIETVYKYGYRWHGRNA